MDQLLSLPLDVTVYPPPRRVPPGPSAYRFPDPALAGPEGFVGAGGDYEPSTLIAAYSQGLFPWPHEGHDYLWWSPDPRAVLEPAAMHVPRRLARTIRSGRYRVTVDAAFRDVIVACASRPEGTWITPRLAAAFARMHTLGWAHSVEVWDDDGELAGGLYGLSVGALFAAESMFFRQRDASKVALVALARECAAAGIELIDGQLLTPHLEQFGFREIPRAEYLERARHLAAALVAFPAGD